MEPWALRSCLSKNHLGNPSYASLDFGCPPQGAEGLADSSSLLLEVWAWTGLLGRANAQYNSLPFPSSSLPLLSLTLPSLAFCLLLLLLIPALEGRIHVGCHIRSTCVWILPFLFPCREFSQVLSLVLNIEIYLSSHNSPEGWVVLSPSFHKWGN